MGRGYFTTSPSTGAKVCNINCRYSQKSIFFSTSYKPFIDNRYTTHEQSKYLPVFNINISEKHRILFAIGIFRPTHHRPLALQKKAADISAASTTTGYVYFPFWYILTGVGDNRTPVRVSPENITSNIRCSSEAAISTSTTRAARKVILQSCNS